MPPGGLGCRERFGLEAVVDAGGDPSQDGQASTTALHRWQPSSVKPAGTSHAPCTSPSPNPTSSRPSSTASAGGHGSQGVDGDVASAHGLGRAAKGLRPHLAMALRVQHKGLRPSGSAPWLLGGEAGSARPLGGVTSGNRGHRRAPMATVGFGNVECEKAVWQPSINVRKRLTEKVGLLRKPAPRGHSKKGHRHCGGLE